MAYRRNYSYRNNYSYSRNVKVTFHYSQLSGCYALKFDNIGNNWNGVKAVIDWLKLTISAQDREYDDINKVWYIHEKFFDTIKGVLEANSAWDVDIIEKQVGSPAVTFVSLDTYISKFKELTGADIASLEYKAALKIFRVTSMKLHPDRNAGDGSLMTDLNVAWDNIKEKHYKIERVAMEQIQ